MTSLNRAANLTGAPGDEHAVLPRAARPGAPTGFVRSRQPRGAALMLRVRPAREPASAFPLGIEGVRAAAGARPSRSGQGSLLDG
jgi:hypothetical protein